MAAALVATLGLIAWSRPRHDSIGARLRRALAGVCALCVAAALGALAVQIRTASITQAPYARRSEPVHVQGLVSDIDASRQRPALAPACARHRRRLRAAAPPRYVRVAVRQAGLLSPGRFADCRAVLGPPSGPMAPGAYDFARRAYFERLGATGYAYGRCRPLDFAPPPSWLDAQRLRISAMRADLSAAIQEAAPGRGGAIAAAMITGDDDLTQQGGAFIYADEGSRRIVRAQPRGIHRAWTPAALPDDDQE